MLKSVTVTVPASTSNLGPGFDCLGLALSIRNRTTLSRHEGELSIEVRGEGVETIFADHTNLVYRAVRRLFEEVGEPLPKLRLIQENRVPIASGLGSSGAAIVGGLTAANYLLEEPQTRLQLLNIAADMEGHPDNVAPALFGGLTLVASDHHGLIMRELPVADMTLAVIMPQVDLATEKARLALPESYLLEDAVFNIGRMGLLIGALESGDAAQLATAMKDRLHQEFRAALIPGMAEALLQATATSGGAAAISGAGPSMVVLAADDPPATVAAVSNLFAQHGLKSRGWVVRVERSGARLEKALT